MYERKQTVIKVFENELRDRFYQQNDEDYLFSDLSGLYVDIIGVISQTDKAKSVVIYDYAKLLEQELQLYSGAEAYVAGHNAKDKPEVEVLNNYMSKIANIVQEQHLYTRTQAYYEEIAGLLGDKCGLISDFTETYRTVHGIIASNIHEFVRLGQTSDMDMTAS